MRLGIAAAVVAAFAFAGPVTAATPKDPGPFVEEFADKALATLFLPKEEAAPQFAALLDEYFDTRRIARFLIGRQWRSISDEQKEAYFEAFDAFLVSFYLNQFAPYREGEVEVLGIEDIDENYLFVVTRGEAPGDDPITAKWRLRRTDDGFKVVDLIIEGVSLSVSQRDQFNSVISSSPDGFDGLIAELRRGAEAGGVSDALVSSDVPGN